MLPNADRAVVDDEKVYGYLLSPSHPVGRFKAAFFRSFGFSVERWELLRDALLEHGRRGPCEQGEASAFGQKYEVCDILVGPTGRSALLMTIWIVRADEDFPRLVTAYPG